MSDPQSEPEPDPYRLSPRVLGLLVAAFGGLLIAALLAVIPLPYAVLNPGPVTNTLGTGGDGKPLIVVKGAPTYATDGSLDFTTVSVLGGPGVRVNAWDVLYGWLDPTAEVFDKDALFPPDFTSDQVRERNASEMVNSQHEAVAVALRSIGQEVGERYLIARVVDDSPATGILEVDDRVTEVDGEPVTSVTAIQEGVRKHRPGSKVTLTVVRDGKPRQVTAATKDADGVAVLGVVLRTEFDYPYEVTIDAGNVGGPSAGTMFALAVRDVLTPGKMTGGKDIAGTGTIDDDGLVGAIGGIRQKVVGAAEAGADYFLAPSANCAELTDHVPDELTVVEIGTFDDAVTAVESIAADRRDYQTCG